MTSSITVTSRDKQGITSARNYSKQARPTRKAVVVCSSALKLATREASARDEVAMEPLMKVALVEASTIGGATAATTATRTAA